MPNAPLAGWNVPELQRRQRLAPTVPLNDPGRQSLQRDDPGCIAYVPGTQAEQTAALLAPTLELAVPEGHNVHVERPSALANLPDWQLKHTDEPGVGL